MALKKGLILADISMEICHWNELSIPLRSKYSPVWKSWDPACREHAISFLFLVEFFSMRHCSSSTLGNPHVFTLYWIFGCVYFSLILSLRFQGLQLPLNSIKWLAHSYLSLSLSHTQLFQIHLSLSPWSLLFWNHEWTNQHRFKSRI